MYNTIMSPINYGGILLKNRIIFAPTTMGLSEEELIQKLRAIGSGGCAMIIIGDVPVSPWSKEPSLYEPDGFAYYARLAEEVHETQCRICAQLYLSDSTAPDGRGRLRPIGKNELKDYIFRLPADELRKYAAMFGEAALLAQRAGFDMVQVLGDRMLGSLCSAIFNGRRDDYGGNVENRARFAAQCVRAIRSRFPGLPIDYKLTVRQENPHYGNAGVLLDEIPDFVPILERAGVTSFHVTLANHCGLDDVIPAARHLYFGAEGCFLKFCDVVRSCTELPVCGVGGLTDPDFIEEQLASSRMDCAAMSRQLIADPDWVSKVCGGRAERIRRCTRCNGRCVQGMMNQSGVHCRYDELPR